MLLRTKQQTFSVLKCPTTASSADKVQADLEVAESLALEAQVYISTAFHLASFDQSEDVCTRGLTTPQHHSAHFQLMEKMLCEYFVGDFYNSNF